ncbi:hypothetical protein CP533_3155 [Ophiocordyceps camponoti-saundersi (nom. inval.)]|nr:hypothetical protein CP533_3155 [Ophiocordyceps camponoti-saundersi (nom. inval.)]
MENDRGEIVDLYVPRKCSATNRITVPSSCPSQRSTRTITPLQEREPRLLPGFVRTMGESDDFINRLAQRNGLLKNSR